MAFMPSSLKKWDTVGPSVCDWVKKVFNRGIMDADINTTLIIIIPKVQNPEAFSQFRPISLCSIIYKLVMKIIANRFKLVFPKIISQEQASFITRRNITDNIFIAQEVIHSMKSNNSRKWMAVKIDLKKVYDQVRWDFIDASLQVAGIPDNLRKVIVFDISTFTMQVMWNGVLTLKFKPVRGIRQGCPLSPYLFVL